MTIRPAIISTARNWWLRSPNPSNANNVRNVNSDGSLNNNNAYNGNSAAADCETSEHKVRAELPGTRPEIKALTQGVADLLRRRRNTGRGCRPGAPGSCCKPRRFLGGKDD